MGVFRLHEDHPKIPFFSTQFILNTAFAVPQWKPANPQYVWDQVQKNSNFIISNRWNGSTMFFICRSMTFATQVYHGWYTWDNLALIPANLRKFCECKQGSTIQEQTGCTSICKHTVLSMLDACQDWKRPTDSFILSQYGKVIHENETVEVECIIHREKSSIYPALKRNLCKLRDLPIEKAIWIEDKDFASFESHIQYTTMMNKLKYSVLQRNHM